ncbi:MAG: glutathione S-transferase family protein [Stellaceae bacterium]
MSMVLHGFRYSVYVRIARIALAEKELTYENVEIDPFATDVPIEYLTLHPFKRVPVLVDSDFALYETEAITRCIDEAFPGPALQPSEPRQRARMAQIISIIDSYGYVPMVRQVAGERVFALLGVGSLTKREFARVLRLPFASLPRSKRSFPAMGLLPGERCGPWPIFT